MSVFVASVWCSAAIALVRFWSGPFRYADRIALSSCRPYHAFQSSPGNSTWSSSSLRSLLTVNLCERPETSTDNASFTSSSSQFTAYQPSTAWSSTVSGLLRPRPWYSSTLPHAYFRIRDWPTPQPHLRSKIPPISLSQTRAHDAAALTPRNLTTTRPNNQHSLRHHPPLWEPATWHLDQKTRCLLKVSHNVRAAALHPNQQRAALHTSSCSNTPFRAS